MFISEPNTLSATGLNATIWIARVFCHKSLAHRELLIRSLTFFCYYPEGGWQKLLPKRRRCDSMLGVVSQRLETLSMPLWDFDPSTVLCNYGTKHPSAWGISFTFAFLLELCSILLFFFKILRNIILFSKRESATAKFLFILQYLFLFAVSVFFCSICISFTVSVFVLKYLYLFCNICICFAACVSVLQYVYLFCSICILCS